MYENLITSFMVLPQASRLW